MHQLLIPEYNRFSNLVKTSSYKTRCDYFKLFKDFLKQYIKYEQLFRNEYIFNINKSQFSDIVNNVCRCNKGLQIMDNITDYKLNNIKIYNITYDTVYFEYKFGRAWLPAFITFDINAIHSKRYSTINSGLTLGVVKHVGF